ncbi:MAG: SUMF1/EgtB/PvdO family nonheme iron enzyme [Planctomycetes bacterium]|nr:SUMF1/EgtB/PvdO family nonheme iron enzyme [Planctomycetota bacterium]
MAVPALTHLGEYALLGELGRGGMGVVYRAEDPRLKREVALKVMLPQFAANPQAKARFVREARAQAKVEHDHVAAIFQVSDHDGLPYLVMPLLKGTTLQAALVANPRPPLGDVIRIGREVAEGLAAAHEKGLVHRDIKPANVWLEGKKHRVKLLDFGLARIVSDAEGTDGPITQEGGVVGTPAYMSPEQGRGLPVDGRTDLFSLGVMLYQMTTGELPFRGLTTLAILTALALDNPPPPSTLNPAVPQALSDFVMRLLAKDPATRPPTAEFAAEEMRAIESGLVNSVRVIPELDTTEVTIRDAEAVQEPDAVDELAKSRGGFSMWASAAGVLLAVAGVVWFVVSQMDMKPADVVKEEPQPPTPQPKDKPPAAGDLFVLKYGNPAVEMQFRWIPPGKFTRGDPPREIAISKGFWMSEMECTQAQWRAIMKARPDPSGFKGDNLPVEQVSPTEADEFCKELAAATRKPVRLPSEAEWEYACRGGTKAEYHSGDGEDGLKKVGWYKGNASGKTQPVGGLDGNLWGLKDMHGNVSEWCQDGFEVGYYGKSPATDPVNTNNQNNSRVFRGGSWHSLPEYCLAAYRYGSGPSNRDYGIGFRVCFREDG